MAVPGCEALRVLGCHAGGGAVGAPEHDGAVDGAGRHVQGFGCAVDDLVDGLHREVERHELADGLEAAECRAHCNPCEPRLQVPAPNVAPSLSEKSTGKSRVGTFPLWLSLPRPVLSVAHLCDGRVPYTLSPVLLQQSARDLQAQQPTPSAPSDA